MRDKLENVSYETIPLLRPFWIGKERPWEPSVSYEIISAFYPLDEKMLLLKMVRVLCALSLMKMASETSDNSARRMWEDDDRLKRIKHERKNNLKIVRHIENAH